MQVKTSADRFDLPVSDRFLTLLTFAEAYQALGYSVIPLLGDLDAARPKVPAVSWSRFQQTHASLHEQNQWFTDSQFSGIGIVTGHISHLVVLDFDSEAVFADFRIRHPDLTETHTVRSATRQLPHLYFKLPDHLHIESMKGQGIDLLSNGRYVVAPPTTINGQSYKVTRGGMPNTLTERDLRRIQAFITSYKLAAHPVQPPQPAPAQPLPKPTAHDLERLYHYHCKQDGRNEALFSTSLYGRDTGWTASETQACLVPLHIHQPASTQAQEAPAHRQREAAATIRSAFSRPPRANSSLSTKRKEIGGEEHVGLPNSVREALIQQGMTFFVRTYEGLLHHGIQPGQAITVKQAIEQLKGIVGRDSIRASFKAKHAGKPLFSPVSPHYAVATDNPPTLSKTAYLIESKNQEKPRGGRPNQVFTLPSSTDLCRILGVKTTSSDPLEASDFVSAQKTRMALHRELIKRRPAQYPRRWLARRLGVSKRTLDTYNHQMHIHSQPIYFETPITWKTIERLPFDEQIQGAFLETAQGKKYPALRSIASRLLVMGQGITLKQRAANFYWYGTEEPVMKRLHLQQVLAAREDRIQAFVAQAQKQLPRPSSPQSDKPKPISPPKPKPVAPRQNFHIPFRDASQEAQAQNLYHSLNQLSAKQLSLTNARRLVARYDAHSLTTALDRLKSFKTLTNPVGLLVTLLRSAKKTLMTP
jgi:hypothetical protein